MPGPLGLPREQFAECFCRIQREYFEDEKWLCHLP
jgi:hypothetical protein